MAFSYQRLAGLVYLKNNWHFKYSRFGIILSLKTKFEKKKDEELFVDYGYPVSTCPKWYRELYKQFAVENPEQASKVALKTIQDIDKKLSEQPIDLLKQ